jgi:hypothetical protein
MGSLGEPIDFGFDPGKTGHDPLFRTLFPWIIGRSKKGAPMVRCPPRRVAEPGQLEVQLPDQLNSARGVGDAVVDAAPRR